MIIRPTPALAVLLFGALFAALPDQAAADALGTSPASTQKSGALAEFTTGGNGWTQFADDDLVGNNGWVGPGRGGQPFDAEYLYFKRDGNLLSIGLQTGFNLATGAISYNSTSPNFWAGDLALSFDASPTTYEYAIDFGLETRDFHGHDPVGGGSGIHQAGLYGNVSWNNDIYYTASGPFAMASGTLITDALVGNTWVHNADLQSYARIVTIDLGKVTALTGLLQSGFTLGAHWTMSCGNDMIEGSAQVAPAPVPEPASLCLFGIGLSALAGLRKRTANG
ncbi:MAG: PEP-CTERM sorting domain-containing protein [Thermodesulfobacteriota bacterium]